MANDILRSVWPEWEIEGTLGRGSYGVVYKAVRRDHNIVSSAAIKVISIPSDPSEIDSLRSEGLDLNATRTYLQGIVNDFVGEIQLMESLKGVQNIVSVEDYKVVEKTDTIGWDIFIRMELLTPLNTHISNRKMTEDEVIKLGTDLCTALELCARKNVIHRDIKPENIFVNQFGDFKLGDFGVARKLENLTAGLSQKGTYNYMAPEIVRGEAYDSTADLYSLGLVLYRFVNKNRLPFLDTERQLLNPNERMAAARRRLDGEPLPPPCEASQALSQVILCACSPDPMNRFSSATAMKNALVYAGSQRGGAAAGASFASEEPGERTVAVHRPARGAQTADPERTTALRRAPGGTQQPVPPLQPPIQSPPQTGGRNRAGLIALLAGLLAVLVLGTVAGLVLLPKLLDGKKDAEEEEPAGSTVQEEPAAEEASAAEEPAPAPAPDISGEWVDTAGGNVYINAAKLSEDTVSFEITAARPYDTQEQWNITARWDPEAQKYTYLGGVKQAVTMHGITPVPNVEYSDGSGSFTFADGALQWDDQKEYAGARCIFNERSTINEAQFQALKEQATQLPLTSELLTTAPDVFAESLQEAAVSSARASSTINQTNYVNYSNDPILLFDGDDTTSWQEGVDGYGEGEMVSVSLSHTYEVKYLSFKLGNWRNEYYYTGNSKPKTMTITVGDYSTQITFEDAWKVQWVGFSRPIPASSVSIRIDEVYPGKQWKDTVICEMTVYGK